MLRIFAGVLLALTVRWLFRGLRQDRRPIPEAALITDGRLLQIEGIDVHYRQEGAGSPVVLAHGLLGSTQTWRTVSTALSEKLSVTSVDLPGSGLSGKPHDFDYSPQSQGRVLARFIEETCPEPVVLVASSASAPAALHAASVGGAKLKLIVLLSPVLGLNLPFDWDSLAPALRVRMLETVLSSRRLLRLLIRWLSGSSRAAASVAESIYMEGRTPGRVAALDRAIGTLLNGEGMAGIGEIEVPIRVVVGGRDPLAGLLDRNFPDRLGGDVSVTVLSRCGHMIELQAPERVAALIERSIEELS
ncbi:MAG: alpha/beta hydrolase [Chloroflexi bacterium]|nr:alpha/beta hydrolase [Chloroflexota bacterium]MCY3937940.1 alpha/beta hydrolase [Chloroflexota bacterium]